MKPSVAAALIAADAAFAAASGAARAEPVASDSSTATYRFVAVDGLKIFYRQAGPTPIDRLERRQRLQRPSTKMSARRSAVFRQSGVS